MKLKSEPFKVTVRLERVPGEVHGKLKKQIFRYIRNESHFEDPRGFNDFKTLIQTDSPSLASNPNDAPAQPNPKSDEPKAKKPKEEESKTKK